MNDVAIAWTVASVALGAVLTLITLCLTGQLVPGSRVDKAEARAEQAKQAAAQFEDAYGTIKGIVERFGLLTDMTGAVLAATERAATGRAIEQRAPGGEH